MLFALLVTLHALAATVWTGGHLVLAFGVLPRALRQGKAEPIRAFEEPFEPLGLAALLSWWQEQEFGSAVGPDEP